jgi:hypothetical protein
VVAVAPSVVTRAREIGWRVTSMTRPLTVPVPCAESWPANATQAKAAAKQERTLSMDKPPTDGNTRLDEKIVSAGAPLGKNANEIFRIASNSREFDWKTR